MPVAQLQIHHAKRDQLPFEDDLRASIQVLRGAFSEILATIDVDATKPQQMAKQVGLDKSLSWKLSRILGEEDAFATAVHMPGKAGLRIVTRSFEKAGASAESIKALHRAIADFDRVIETHCGDRETLELMLGNLRRDGQAQHDESLRRKSFQGNSAVWGIQARMQIASHYIAPNAANPDLFDIATVSGLIDLRRLRSDVPWAVASVRQFTGDGTAKPHKGFEPIDSRVTSDQVPLLLDFCSQPAPSLRIAPGLPGVTRYEIASGPVGSTAATTCITGWMNRACVSRFRTQQDELGELMSTISTPSELLISDVYIHRDAGMRLPPQLALYSMLPGEPPYPMAGRDRGMLPLREGMTDLGASPPDTIVPEFARYRQLVDLVCERMGWSSNDFAGYRLRMRYAPIPTLTVFRFPLAERPA